MPTPVESSCGDGICHEEESSIACPNDCLVRAQINVNLAACTQEVSKATADKHVEPVFDVFRALNVVNRGVDSVNDLAADTHRALYRLSEAPAQEALRTSFSFDPTDARYRSTDGWLVGKGVALDVQLRYGADYANAAKDDVISPFFFQAGSYLVNPRIVGRGEFDATIEHDGPGPLAELIGDGPTPASPLTVNYSQAHRETGQQILAAQLTYTHEGRAAKVSIDASWRRAAASATAAFNVRRMELDTPDASLRGVNLSTAEELSGMVRLDMRRAPFAYDATITVGRGGPAINIVCGPTSNPTP